VPLVPLVLDHNLRNTRQIANAFQPLVDHPMRFLGGRGARAKRGDELIGLWLGPFEPQSAVGRSRIGSDADLMSG
jgi:hypothetical protein